MLETPVDSTSHPIDVQHSQGVRDVGAAAFWTKSLPLSVLRDWQRAAVRQLREIHALPMDWDGYGSPKLSERAFEQVWTLIFGLEVDFLPTPNIGPESGGAVQLDWSNGQRALEFHFLADGTVSFLKLESGACVEDGELPAGAIDDWRLLVDWLQEADLPVPATCGAKPAVRAVSELERGESILSDTDVVLSLSEMAKALDRIGKPTTVKDVELTFDPDDYPLG